MDFAEQVGTIFSLNLPFQAGFFWQQVVWDCLWQQVPDHWYAIINWGKNFTV